MASADVVHLRPAGLERAAGVPSATLAVVLFVCCEVMFFAGLISAHTIDRAMVPVWPPLDQPRLPIESTAFNTLVLLASGALAVVAGRKAERGDYTGAWRPMVAAFVAGLAFVGLQGVEWVQLLNQGLSLRASAYGGFFYLVVGAHALHAMAGLIAYGAALRGVALGTASQDQLLATRVYWMFVVALWPILYWRVYL